MAPFLITRFLWIFPFAGSCESKMIASGNSTSSYSLISLFGRADSSFLINSFVGSFSSEEPANQINTLFVFQEFTQAFTSAIVTCEAIFLLTLNVVSSEGIASLFKKLSMQALTK